MTTTNESRKTSFDIDGTSTFTYSYTFDIVNVDSVGVSFFDTDGEQLVITMTRVNNASPNANEFYVDQDNDQIIIGAGGDAFLQDQYGTNITQLLITRDVDVTQEEVFPTATSLQADSIELALDKNVLIIQQVVEEVARCLKIPIQDSSASVTDLAAAAARANGFLSFDASGDPLIAAAITDAGVTAAIIPFVQALTLAAARTVLAVYSQAEVDAAIVIINATITALGIVVADATMTLINPDEENTDGGRPGKFIVKGTQTPGGEVSTLGYIEFSHEGTGNDQKGQCRIVLNDGNDDNTPSKVTIVFRSDGLIEHSESSCIVDQDNMASDSEFRLCTQQSIKAYVDNSIPTVFTDRGDPAAFDFAVGVLTTDGSWYDLDLSSVVPANAIAVLLGVNVNDDTIGQSIAFRKNGNSNSIATSSVRTQVANQQIEMDVVVACDANRVIEYITDNNTFTAINIKIKGWWI